jgi:hypothetical protein
VRLPAERVARQCCVPLRDGGRGGPRDFVDAGAWRLAEAIRVAFEAGRAAARSRANGISRCFCSRPRCDITAKLLAHIGGRSPFDDREVKCDAAHRSLTGTDRFIIAALSEIIARNSSAMEVFTFALEPHSKLCTWAYRRTMGHMRR